MLAYSPLYSLVLKLLYEFYGTISLRDLKHKLQSFSPGSIDEELEKVIEELKEKKIILIQDEKLGTMSEKVIQLTREGVRQSSSGSA